MLISLSLPVLVLAGGLTGIPGLNLLKGFKLRHPPPPPADTLPPAWKPYSRLALESLLLRPVLPSLRGGPMGFKLNSDPRTLVVHMDPDSGRVSAVPQLGDVALGAPSVLALNEFSGDLTRRTFARQMSERSVDYLRQQTDQAAAAAGTNRLAPGGLSFKLPSPLPRQVQSLLGPGGPALNISGSENIRLSGQSNWTNQQIGIQGRAPSLFPSLDMQQDLDIRLEGQLSDRVRVNLLQNSGIQIPLANRIAINYKGEEDDLVQELDLGNTNLSLPGTQYVSYSGKNEGLFGIKSALRVGPLDFAVLASKQEGRSERASYHGGGSNQTNTLADLDYVKGVYYYLYDPNLDVLQIENSDIAVYLDDYNYSNDQNSIAGRAFVDTSLTASGATGTPMGTYGDSTVNDTASVRGTYTLLFPGADQDYTILEMYGPRFKVIRLNRQITGEQRLAVTYRARRVYSDGTLSPPFQVGGRDTVEADGVKRRYLKLLRAPSSIVQPNPTTLLFDRSDAFARTRDLELKNFYQLPGQRIDPASFKLSIRKGVDVPAVTSVLDPLAGAVPYLEVCGLDSYDQATGQPIFGKHDGVLDGTYLGSGSQQAFVDYENGTMFFPDPRPFAPRIGDAYRRTTGGPSLYPFDQAVSYALSRRDSLVGAPGTAIAPNPGIYDKYIVQRALDTVYYLDFTFTAAQTQGVIDLGRGNILEGSEVVTVSGQTWVRDKDYTIDYDLGRVTLKRQLNAADQLNIDYSFAPLFQQAGRTLIGSAFRLEGLEKSFGGAFMYESQGAQDIRPRLGEEPSRSLIGDLNTAWGFHPDWITRMVDRLPGIRTTAPSDFNVQAEVGASFPNPNTKNVIYIDDMDGVRDGVALTMSADRWMRTSPPLRRNEDGHTTRSILADTTLSATRFQRDVNAEMNWFTPIAAVKESDLKPNLTDAEGAGTTHSVLALSMPRRPKTAMDGDSLWAGLTYPLDPTGLDLSRAQFIEVWVNDFRDSTARANSANRFMKLHIDLGWVSEDQMRSPDVPPNGILDTEDRVPRDGQLDVTGARTEDTGYDGLTDADEIAAGIPIRDLTTATGEDPEGDDYWGLQPDHKPPNLANDDIDPVHWRSSNGTEGNHTLNPNPDTEDLNRSGNLETDERNFDYTIGLCDTCETYLVTDVQRDFRHVVVPHPPLPGNGWRRYRIPIEDARRDTFGLPDLTLSRQVRVWVEGVMETDPPRRPLLMLGGVEIVGSRWFTSQLTPSQETAGTKLTLSTLNTVDNADEYTAPFDPGSDRSGGQTVARREQSLSVEFENLLPQDTLEVFRTFSIDEDYSRYGKLAWFVSGLKITDYKPGVTPLYYFVRFASDELGTNYYEYKARVPQRADASVETNPLKLIDWNDIRLELTALSNLKLRSDFPTGDSILYQVPGPQGNDVLTISGHPSFTRLRRISFGIINQDTLPTAIIHSGKILLDELRATDIAKDAGYAERLQVNGRLANLAAYNFSWNGRDANFQSVGESRGSGNSEGQLTAGANVDLHRFFEGTGILLPVALNYAKNTSRPRFTAGDDVIRTGALEAASETKTEMRSLSANYSRLWSPRALALLRYTLGGITASYNRNQSDLTSPTGVATYKGMAANVNYGIAPRDLLILRLPLTKARFYPLPERFFWNYNVATTEQIAYDRSRDANSLVLRNDLTGRIASINFGADTRPFDFFHHHIEAIRNLTLPDQQREQIGFINLGRVVTWRQNMDAHYSPNRGPWLSPSLGWSGNYAQDNRPELSPDLSVRALANGQSLTATWVLPFDRMQPKRAAADTGRAARRSLRDPIRGLLYRLGAISAEGGYNQTSSYSRLLGTTDFMYLMGLSDNPGLKPDGTGRMRDTTGNTISKGTDWRAAARTRLLLPADAAVSVRGEYTWRRSEVNLVASKTTTSRFPDLEFDYGNLPTRLQLNRLLNQPRIRTSYSRSRVTDYRVTEDSPSSIATSSQWQPLIGLTGDFKNQTRAEFKIERRVTERQDLNFGTSTRTDRNTDVNLSLTRSYSRGQKVKILGKESTIRSSVQLGLTAVYSRVSGETRRVGYDTDELRTDQDRLSVNGTGSYSFSNNVTGSVVLGFGQNRDLVRAVVSRNVRVELRAAFNF